MTPQETSDAEVRAKLQKLGALLDRQLPYGWGFVFLVFPFGAGGRLNYISNAQRPDVVRAMYEFIEATRTKWAQHEPELSAAAEDEQLGRVRQELAELGRLLTRAADALEEEFGPPSDPAHGVKGPVHELIAELRKAAQ